MAKEIEIEGYGKAMITPIVVKDKDYETVDPNGRPVTKERKGEGSKTVYYTEDGTEIPANQLCKKIPVEDEEVVVSKFQPTKKVPQDNVKEIGDNSIIYKALTRKFYNVVTDDEKLKDLVLNQNKSLEFPFVAGAGWKIWKAVLTNWNNKLLLIACRGDLTEELKKYEDDTVEFELESVPQEKNMKKLVHSMAGI